MRRTSGTAALVVTAAILTSTVNPPTAQRRRTPFPDLVDRLGLTAAGAPGWLERLGVTPRSDRLAERLLLVNLAGETILQVEGQEQRVAATADLNQRLLQANAEVVLIHNHPAGTGLSAGDLIQLAKPAVSAIAAIGHDGSVFVAATGRRYGGHDFDRTQYRIACGEVDRRMSWSLSGPASRPWRASVPLFFAHLVASALAQASVIEYRAFLSPRTTRVYAPVAADGNRAIAAAARVVASPNRVLPPQPRRGGFCV